MTRAKLLLVEEDNHVILSVKEALASFNYPDLVVVSSVNELFEAVRKYSPDLVLMNVLMVDDLAATDLIQLDIPLICLSAQADPTVLQKARAAQASGLLLLPFADLQFHAAVDLAVARYEQAQEAQAGLQQQMAWVLTQKAVELERINTEMKQLIYVASHDLREPLRKITSYTELLQRRYGGQLDDRAEKYMDYIVDGAVRMQQLLADLLLYSRIGGDALFFAPVDFTAVFEQAVTNLKRVIREETAVISHDALPGAVTCDTKKMVQLMQQLISNGIKFRRAEAPRLHFSAERQEGQWLFKLQDNGIGIEAKDEARIFQVFQRLHTRSEFSGTGMGLAICKKIIERHNGRIWVESEIDKGTTFFFTLPDQK